MQKGILIVDDEVELTQILDGYFRVSKGYNVFIANDGNTALDLIKKKTPELVLLDMKLPSVNGLEILKVLRNEYPKTKVIVMTAYDLDYKKEIDAVGYDAFFVKPIAFEEFKNAIEDLCAGKTLSQQPPVDVVSGLSSKEKQPALQGGENCVPCARIVVVEIRDNVADMLKDYLENLENEAKYAVLVVESGAFKFNKIAEFKPDIVLYDVLEIDDFSDFASRLMKLGNPPKEVILFGDPKFKWEEVDSLVKRGMYYIPTPLKAADKRLSKYPDLNFPAKETVQRLAQIIKEVCFKRGLITPKGETDHAQE
ncbi:MAG: response regulator [Candidatus Omnitrophica bacterium]|nr:response regulator [Candidatus Omnitrophota bacterium]